MRWKKININNYADETGVLSVIEQDDSFNFDVKRVFLVSCVKDDEIRGKHAHQELKQIIFSASGTFSIKLNDGCIEEVFSLSKNGDALLVEGLVWRTMYDFSHDAVMVVLCDRVYAEDKVIRDYDAFLEASRGAE